MPRSPYNLRSRKHAQAKTAPFDLETLPTLTRLPSPPPQEEAHRLAKQERASPVYPDEDDETVPEAPPLRTEKHRCLDCGLHRLLCQCGATYSGPYRAPHSPAVYDIERPIEPIPEEDENTVPEFAGFDLELEERLLFLREVRAAEVAAMLIPDTRFDVSRL